MTAVELLCAHRALWRRAFDPAAVAERIARGARRLSKGGLMLSVAMNGFYGLKRLTGNLPADQPLIGRGRIVHPDIHTAPVRLTSNLGIVRPS